MHYVWLKGKNMSTDKTYDEAMNPEITKDMLALGLNDKLGKCHPKLARNQVWCRTCGRSERVDSAECIRDGWPKCCGYTMTIDAPEDE